MQLERGHEASDAIQRGTGNSGIDIGKADREDFVRAGRDLGKAGRELQEQGVLPELSIDLGEKASTADSATKNDSAAGSSGKLDNNADEKLADKNKLLDKPSQAGPTEKQSHDAGSRIERNSVPPEAGDSDNDENRRRMFRSQV